jgi:predicted nucleotide-binding protein
MPFRHDRFGTIVSVVRRILRNMSHNEADPRSVFVIHGRNEPARKGLFDFLRSIGLSPIEWSEAISMTGSASPYIGDVLDAAFLRAQAVVVLQTPDDVAHLHESLTYPGDPETNPQMQPRPNVLYEAGMAMGRSPERTVIVELGQVKVFSDIHGRHAVRLDNSVAKRQDLATRLRNAGCSVNLDGTDWHEAGDLTPPSGPGGGLPLGRKLPSSQSAGLPRLTARLHERGGNKFSDVIVTNHGPGTVYELTAEPTDEDDLLRASDELPVPQLPVGKSVRVLQRMPASFSQVQRSYFTIKLRGRTADGVHIDHDEFVSRD